MKAKSWKETALRGYQLEGAEWLIDLPYLARGRLLADGLGTGKALALNTPIPTPQGWKTMADLKVGDEVFGANGKPCKVINTFDVPKPNGVFDVYLSDGEVIRACGDHLWLTFTNSTRKALRRSNQARDGVMYGEKECVTQPRVRDTRTIAGTTKGTNGREHALQMNGMLVLPALDLPLDPYLLGVWLGDGHSKEGAITIHANEGAIAQAFHAYEPRKSKVKGNAVTWRFNRDFTAHLRRLHVYRNKHVPDEYLWSSAVQRLALLQGLMDTDGTISPSGTCCFDNTNEHLVDSVLFLCASLGIKATKSVKYPKVTGRPEAVCKPYFKAHFTTTKPVFRHSSFKCDRLPLDVRETARWRYIDRVVRVDSTEPMKCITVDAPDALYLCGKSLVVTHNTRTALAAQRLRWENGLMENPCGLVFTTAISAHDWAREAARFWPELKVHLLGSETGYRRKGETKEAFEARRDKEWQALLRGDEGPALLVSSYEGAARIDEYITPNDILFDSVTIDEAHNLKKASTSRATMLRSFVARSRQTTLLTGTPVHNRPHELHNLLDLCQKNAFGSFWRFAERFFQIHVGEKGRGQTVGDVLDKQMLQEAITPFVRGRTAAEVMGQMPARQRVLKLVDAPGAERISPAKLHLFKESTGIAAACRGAVKYKLEAAVQLVIDIDKPVVLYTYRREDAELLAKLLRKAQVSVSVATGDTTSSARDKVIEGWKAGGSTALVCTMDAVRESATLVRADTMVFVDLTWLPGTILQCEGRIDPARQPENERRPVTYYYLVTKDGPDEVVAESLIHKIEQASGIGVQNREADAFGTFLTPLDKREKPSEISEADLLSDLTARLAARANRLADLGML